MVIAEYAATAPGRREPKVTLARLRDHPLLMQIVQFLIIGVGCTVVTVVLYTVLRTWLNETWSDVLAFGVTTVVSSMANRKITFGSAQTFSRLRLHAQSLLVMVFYCTSTGLALDGLGVIVANPTPAEQALAVWLVSLLGGTARFLLMRSWVFRDRGSSRARRRAGRSPAAPRI